MSRLWPRAAVVASVVVAWMLVPRRTDPYLPTGLPKPGDVPVNHSPTDLPIPEDVESFVNSIGMRMIRIPAGRYSRGSPDGERGRSDDEVRPEVVIEKDFWISQTEVTQAEWRAIIDYNPSQCVADSLPVTNVTIGDAHFFCDKLAFLERRKYRLPNDEEWEHACRAGDMTADPNGSRPSPATARIACRETGHGDEAPGPLPVGSFAPNAWGLYDMLGNVAEWTLYPGIDVKPEDIPRYKPDLMTRAGYFPICGGSWDTSADDCLFAKRDLRYCSHADAEIGFRIALSAE